MDEMKLKTGFMKHMVSGILSRLIKKKLGYDVKVSIQDLEVGFDDTIAKVHLEVDGYLSKEQLKEILSGIGA